MRAGVRPDLPAGRGEVAEACPIQAPHVVGILVVDAEPAHRAGTVNVGGDDEHCPDEPPAGEDRNCTAGASVAVIKREDGGPRRQGAGLAALLRLAQGEADESPFVEIRGVCVQTGLGHGERRWPRRVDGVVREDQRSPTIAHVATITPFAWVGKRLAGRSAPEEPVPLGDGLVGPKGLGGGAGARRAFRSTTRPPWPAGLSDPLLGGCRMCNVAHLPAPTSPFCGVAKGV